MKRFVKIVTGALLLLFIVAGVGLNRSYRFFSCEKINAKMLTESLKMGQRYLINQQNNDGSFKYEYDLKAQKYSDEVSPVRQTGAMWGLVSTYEILREPAAERAIQKGFDFYQAHSVYDSTRAWIVFPGTSIGSTGTLALASLALIDYIRTREHSEIIYQKLLFAYLKQIENLSFDEAHFYPYYDLKSGKGYGKPSPYFDGEALLCLVKSVKYLSYDYDIPQLIERAGLLREYYVDSNVQNGIDATDLKGFYQWGSMSFYEIYDAGWDDSFAETIIDMALWMIDVHKTLRRMKNTAYAQEGILHAYLVAQKTGNSKIMRKTEKVARKVLLKLTTWQVQGPRQNFYLMISKPGNELTAGGVLNSAFDTRLRIDVCQHQMHAVSLALNFLYPHENP